MKPAELNHYLLALKLSQSALARLLKVHVMTVNRWCRGLVPVPEWAGRLVKMWVAHPESRAMWKEGDCKEVW